MEKIKIGNITIDSNIILAPMAGYTNIAYRKLLKPFGCGLVVSEMISDFALIYDNAETIKMLATCKEERPVAIQLFGGSKESLLKGLKILEEKADFDILDINMGCPVPKVTKANAGSAWLKRERQEELLDTMTSIVKESKHPVTVKIRLGYYDNDITVLDTVKILEKAGVSLIAIHGRTRAQMYMGSADYEYIKKAKEIVSVPVIANGDIDSIYKAKEVLEYTKADGIMIGRGALGNPHLITEINEYLNNGTIIKTSSLSEQIKYCKKHYYLLKEIKGEFRAIQEMRGIASKYFKGFEDLHQYRVLFATMSNENDFEEILQKITKSQQ